MLNLNLQRRTKLGDRMAMGQHHTFVIWALTVTNLGSAILPNPEWHIWMGPSFLKTNKEKAPHAIEMILFFPVRLP